MNLLNKMFVYLLPRLLSSSFGLFFRCLRHMLCHIMYMYVESYVEPKHLAEIFNIFFPKRYFIRTHDTCEHRHMPVYESHTICLPISLIARTVDSCFGSGKDEETAYVETYVNK